MDSGGKEGNFLPYPSQDETETSTHPCWAALPAYKGTLCFATNLFIMLSCGCICGGMYIQIVLMKFLFHAVPDVQV